jgi:N-acetylmuramoyl-L-alanine amidase
VTPFPLKRGQHGEPIRDLQRRLGAAGYSPDGAEAGLFCASTEAALQKFQQARGLHASGVCDEQSWLAIIEAGWKLGDRLLVLTAPQLRGDDVEDLQRALNHVGFDCGRSDGILGPATIRALVDFQHNCGIDADGICGRKTVHMLDVLRRQSGSGPGVASVREIESVRRTTSLHSLRIVVGQFGGLSSIGRSVARSLRQRGATVMSTDEYDAAAQAAAANRFAATMYIGFEAQPYVCADIAYFAVPSFESVGGRSLGAHLVRELDGVLPIPPTLRGMRLPVLRETRMPAVLCSVGPVRDVVDATGALTAAVVQAARRWGDAPLPVPSD